MLEWLNDIFQAILKFVPRIIIVKVTHAGLKYRYGSEITELRHNNGLFYTGIHFYWPLVTEYDLIPIKRQTVELRQQNLCTADNQTVGVSGILVYEIFDIQSVLTEWYDYDDNISELPLATIKAIITKHKFDYIQSNSSSIDNEITQKLRNQLEPFGVDIIKVTLSDFVPLNVYSIWGVSFNVGNSE